MVSKRKGSWKGGVSMRSGKGEATIVVQYNLKAYKIDRFSSNLLTITPARMSKVLDLTLAPLLISYTRLV